MIELISSLDTGEFPRSLYTEKYMRESYLSSPSQWPVLLAVIKTGSPNVFVKDVRLASGNQQDSVCP